MNIFKDLIAGGIAGIGKAAKDVIDSINAPKEAKAEAELKLQEVIAKHQELLITQANDLEKAYLADIADSRTANAKIQESVSASWLAKNIGYCIDIFVTLLWGVLTAYLLAVMLTLAPKQSGVDYTAVTAVWGAVSAQFMTILTWHRGSSQGSADKQKLIDKMSQK